VAKRCKHNHLGLLAHVEKTIVVDANERKMHPPMPSITSCRKKNVVVDHIVKETILTIKYIQIYEIHI